MSKYSNELKLEIVNFYLNNSYGFEYVAQKYNIPAWTTIRKWVRKYNEHGPKGLIKNQKSSYSGEFKRNVVEYMHINHLSAKETAFHFNLGSEYQAIIWERIYYKEGPQALYEERRGRPRKMNSNESINKKKLTREEELIEETKRLKMENEYLKKLNALVQERIKRENKKK